MSDKNFEQLLAELNATADEQSTLAKALPQDDGADDKAIQAAAAEGEEQDDEGAEPAEGEEGAGEEKMTKSMTIDGEAVEVIDGEQMLKSLGELGGRLTATEETLAKALATTLSITKTQGDMIKSLNDRLEKLAGQGKGRKTVISVVERPATTLAKSEPAQIQPGEIMAKALSAQKAGKLTGIDVARCESALNSGAAVPADVLAKLN